MADYLLDTSGDFLSLGGDRLILDFSTTSTTVVVGGGGSPTSSPSFSIVGRQSDIATIWDVANGRGDWAMDEADLAAGNDLPTALLISLFTDRSALPDDVIPDGTNDRRGWLGDLDEDYPIGSRLWLLDRAKQTDETLARAKEYMAEALQWMIDDGVAGSIDIYAEWTRPGMLGARITVYQPAKGAQSTLKFDWAWQGIR